MRNYNYCLDCIYWFPDEDEPGRIGFCHRFPPTVSGGPLRIGEDEFPRTNEYNWCGEYKK